MVPWAHPSPQPKRYLDRFSRFSEAHQCDRLTDRSTDHATRLVTIDHIDILSTAMRSNNNLSFRTIQVSWYQRNIHSLTLHLQGYYPTLISFIYYDL